MSFDAEPSYRRSDKIRNPYGEWTQRFRTLVLASFVRNHAVGRESKENEND